MRFEKRSTGPRRVLLSECAITDTYDYDAFGNLLHSTGTTANNYLFAGEQFDTNLNLYYNRARYLSTNTGRFWTMDTYEGDPQSPLSLHKYLYTAANPVDVTDPSGQVGLVDDEVADAESESIDSQNLQILQTGKQAINLARFAAVLVGGIALPRGR